MSCPIFTRTTYGPDVPYMVFSCDDGFEYLAAMAPRNQDGVAVLGQIAHEGRWQYVEATTPGVLHESHRHAGPVTCFIYRRPLVPARAEQH